MSPSEHDAVAFGPFRLYTRHRRLFYVNEEVHLGGRATDVLLALAGKQGELVAKEHLLAAAWPDTVVHESNLKVTIASLRRALREYVPSHEYINTVVGRGYWLSTDASPEAPGDPRISPSPPASPFQSSLR